MWSLTTFMQLLFKICPSTFLHAVTHFDQAYDICHTILGSKANILSIKCDDLSNYIRTNYTTDHMVLMGAGGIDHNELVTFLPSPSPSIQLPLVVSLTHDPASLLLTFASKTMIFCVCTLKLQVEGVGWSSPDYFPMLMMQTIMGNWHRSLDTAPLLSSHLSHIISSNNLVNSFMLFSTS